MLERIRTLLESRQLTPTQFADLIGVARPIVSHILSGRNKPSLEVVQRILAAMPDLAMPWLLNGSGPMVAAASPLAGNPVPAAATLAPLAPAIAATLERADRPQPAVNRRDVPGEHEALVPKPSAGTPVGRHGAKVVEQAARFDNSAARQRPATFTRFVAKPAAFEKSGQSGQIKARGPAAPVSEPALAPSGPSAAPTASQVFNVAEPTAVPPLPDASETGVNTAPTSAVAQAMFAGADKPIRRIVIFYRDGSFADYQPE